MYIFTTIEAITYFASICTALFYLKGCTVKNKACLIISPVLFSALMGLGYMTINNFTVFSSIAIAMLLLSAKFIFKNSKFITIIIPFALLYSVNISIVSTVTFILEQSKNLSFASTLSFILSILFNIGFIVIVKLKHAEIRHCLQAISKPVKILTFLSLIACAFVLIMISESPNFANASKWDIAFKIAMSIFVIIIGAIVPILSITSYSKNHYMKQSEDLEKQFQIQADYYKSLAKSNFELRQFRHDYNNMKIGISELLKESKNEEALNMLDCCDKQLLSATRMYKFDTGNSIADALLMDKRNKASTFNTEIIFSGTVSNKINPTDLCVIFGNALDNAIEACEKIESPESKTIQVKCECRGGFMFLIVTNPVCEDVLIKNNTVFTSKEDTKSHGFGLLSIKRAAKKYDGNLELSCTDKKFSLSVDLCLL